MQVDYNYEGRQIGSYRLQHAIGHGGMSVVYLAQDTQLNRQVAVKILPQSLITADPQYIQRFRLEAQTSAQLSHPNIIPIYAFQIQQDISYIVMPYLQGGTLSQRLEQRGHNRISLPSNDEIINMTTKISHALYHAHQQNIIHRDIKPANIMFDLYGTPYVTDFGIASLMSHQNTRLTQTGQSLGTPYYMPPEQWSDRSITPAVDQYALAVVVYSLLTGHVPFDAPSRDSIMYKHVMEPPPPLSTFRQDLSFQVNLIIQKALSKNPSDRYPTIVAFADALAQALSYSGQASHTTQFFSYRVEPQSAQPPRSASMRIGTAQPPRQQQSNTSNKIALLLFLFAFINVLIVGGLFIWNQIQPPESPGASANVSVMPTLTDMPTATPTVLNLQPPVANFTSSSTRGVAPLVVDFTNNSIGESVSYQWQFGTGASSTEKSPRYTFEQAGVYNVVLIVKNAAGEHQVVQQITVSEPITDTPLPSDTPPPTDTQIPTIIFPSITPTVTKAPTRTFTPTATEVILQNEIRLGDIVSGNLNIGKFDTWQYKAGDSGTIGIALNSTEFDATLILLSEDGQELKRDDDGGHDTNAHIRYQVSKSQVYTILASSFNLQGGGRYNLLLSEIYPQCSALIPQMQMNGTGRVIFGGKWNRLRQQASLSGRELTQIPGGAVFEVIDGPRCADGYTWWKVDYNGTIGWTAESDDEQYWIEMVDNDRHINILGSDGALNINAFCRAKGYSSENSDTHWFCTQNGNRIEQLNQYDFDQVCRDTYGVSTAFAIQRGTSENMSFNWKCYQD